MPLTVLPRVAALYQLQEAVLEPRLKEFGIGMNTFQLLTAIRGAGEHASQNEVARRLGVTPATLSESVTSHVKRGFIRQEPSEYDKRVKVLVLTARAQEILGRVLATLEEIEELMIRSLSDSQRIAFEKILDRCLGNLERQVR